ncbi:hypothetical protein GCM10011509_05820 [Ornithinimicrobium pekingense]|uniref:Luciferase-like domain-containing protein n=1 Tax=Ornithinimicrobium pekingense TaxID=384677 RepID=A0ABQ2F7C2_9MICO|nr:hypothetical protein GCM10011509_05820 [Ornithinimicrobium pekingense]
MSIPPFTDAATVVVWAREAEAAGWDGVFLWDHVQWSADVAPLDPWVLLGAVAHVTDHVRIGTMVTPLSRRRPYAVAKQLTTLDHLSRGRAVLGVGLGEPVDRDFADLGEEADRRVRRSCSTRRWRWSTGSCGGRSTTPGSTTGSGPTSAQGRCNGRGRPSGWRAWRRTAGRWRGRAAGTGSCRSGRVST